MTNKSSKDIKGFFIDNFTSGSNPHWSYPLFIMSILSGLFFFVRTRLTGIDEMIPATSLIGYTCLMICFVILTLILPTIRIGKDITHNVLGSYSGIGSLILAFLSGIPLMCIKTALFNYFSWMWLRLGFKTVYPALFYYSTGDNITGKILAFAAETVIPAFGCSLFFFGLVWSRFRSKERFVGYGIIAVFYMLWSMDPMNAFSLILIGVWCAYLRTTTDNIWGPFLCFIGIRFSEFILQDSLSGINLLNIQTYSDISSTYLYASFPALLIGIITLSAMRRFLSDFYYKYKLAEEEEALDRTIPAFVKGINFSIPVTLIIMITIFVLICKGVHI